MKKDVEWRVERDRSKTRLYFDINTEATWGNYDGAHLSWSVSDRMRKAPVDEAIVAPSALTSQRLQ